MPGQVAQPQQEQGGGLKEGFTRKWGPLAVWQWAVILVLVLVLVIWWRSRSSSSSSSSTSTSAGNVYDQQNGPWNDGSGNYVPGGSAGPPPPNTVPSTTDTAPPAGGAPPPQAPPQQAAGGWVTVTKWPDNINHESTLWDIAGKWLPAGAPNWGQIWNDPQNAAVVAQRGSPGNIQAGDRFWVPGKLSTPRD